MPKQSNTVFMIPGTPDQRRFRAVPTYSKEYVDSDFEKITTNLQFESIIENNYPAQDRSREDEVSAHRNSLENIFNPQPSREQIAKILEEISAYLMQEGDLLDGYREYISGGK